MGWEWVVMIKVVVSLEVIMVVELEGILTNILGGVRLCSLQGIFCTSSILKCEVKYFILI